ncbi:MAG TPA: transcriptional regulator FtrA [Woeseiaceae bacterium]|nr:transcriptional regulator FtrA [Woeseiaceae bacterium]
MTSSVKKPSIRNRPANPAAPLVLALVYDRLCNFEFACAAEVFGLTRPEFEGNWYRFETCSLVRRPVTGQFGMRIKADAGLERMRDADIVVIAGWSGLDVPVPPALVSALHKAHDKGATLLSICSGAFVLAATGLLDGQRATTHWRYASTLQQRYPRINVDPAVLYIDNGTVMTSAGSAAGLDLCLHVVRRDFGPEIANQIARRLVIPPHRDGGQAQFVERSVQKRERSPISGVIERMQREPASGASIAELAASAAMSERTFLRRFKEATGTTPGEYLSILRLEHGRELLAISDKPIDIIALECGFGGAATLRHHFRLRIGITPTSYRNRFKQRSTTMITA